jgi:hypothetical protein
LFCAHFARRWVIGYAGLNNHSRAFSYCQTRCAVLLSCFAYVLNFSLCFAGCRCEVVHCNYSGLIYFQSELTRCLMTWSPASPPASLYFFCFCFPCFVLLVHRPRSHSCVTCVQDIYGAGVSLLFFPLVSTSFCVFDSYNSEVEYSHVPTNSLWGFFL